jgi:hypothetical protein
MKKNLLIAAFIVFTISAIGQNQNNKFGITAGAFIQHYNGNLGNSFFKFKTICFGGGTASVGMYLNKSFDVNLGVSICDFGYGQTESDRKRIISESQQCPGCDDILGMGNLQARMVAGNIAIKYKFTNGYLLKENSKFSSNIFLGMGINNLTDNMGRNCVNTGNHFTINSGLGITYNITERLNIGYNLAFGCFVTKKVYNTNTAATESQVKDADDILMEKRKDFYMQNGLSLGVNF